MRNFSLFNSIFRKIFQDVTSVHITSFFKSFTFKKFINLIFIKFQSFFRLSHISGFPYTLTINPNTTCNLKCKLCLMNSNFEKKNKHLSFEDFKIIFDQFKDYLFIIHLYYWGESFLHKDIYKIIKYASDNGVFVSISTNFSLKIDFEKLIESRLDHLIISIDGHNEEIYKEYWIGGDFKLVISNIKKLVLLKKEKKSIFHLFNYNILYSNIINHILKNLNLFQKSFLLIQLIL